jgi:uncharacterized protein YndB with AHSA1/START domain
MEPITVRTTINAPLETVWHCWTEPAHITQWCFASADWETPRAENDVRTGGKFLTRMAAKDGSVGFDFTGTYTAVEPNARLAYVMEDGRKVALTFAQTADGVEVTETFDPETENPAEMQRSGWQAILDNFKTHAETTTSVD